MITDTVQRFTGGRESRRPAGELMKRSAYDVAPIVDWKIAAGFVELNHYSHSTSSTSHSFGLYGPSGLEGVALFGPPPSMNAHRAVWPTLRSDEAVTLGRLVLTNAAPGNCESFLIARCFELLAERGVVGVESCSDPIPREDLDGDRVFRGHIGCIYQATNGRFVGLTNPATLRLLPDGTCLNNRACSKLIAGERGGLRAVAQLVRFGAVPLEPGEDPLTWLRHWRPRLTRPMRHPGNLRYLWCLNRRRRREVLTAPALPYQKMDTWTPPRRCRAVRRRRTECLAHAA